MVASAQGEDRSSFQPAGRPWTGLQFGFAKATEGVTFHDGSFQANWNTMKAEGKHRGAYHFWHPALDAHAQASFFVSRVKACGLVPGDILAADIELTAGLDGSIAADSQVAFRSHLLSLTPDNGILVSALPADQLVTAHLVGQTFTTSQLAAEVRTFLDAVHALAPHNPVIIYTTRSIGATLGNCTGYPLWTAAPGSRAPASVAPWSHWTFWQFAFGGGQVGSDQDAFNGTEAQLQAWLDSYHPEAQPSGPPVLRTADGKTSWHQMAAAHGRTDLEMLWATIANSPAPGPAQTTYIGGILSGKVTVSQLMPAGMRVWA